MPWAGCGIRAMDLICSLPGQETRLEKEYLYRRNRMKAISATPKEIRKVFSSKFVIPSFQRPYSWEMEQCEKLWDDITDFHATKTPKDKYFLGNIVLHPAEDDDDVLL